MKISEALGRLAAGVGARDIFAVERSQRAGSPALWEEVISLHAGGQGVQRYLRVRSQADEGGAPIGRWWAPAPSQRATSLAAALLDLAIWTLPSEAIAPGEEVITWRWVTQAGVGQLAVPAGSPTLNRLRPLDLELRRVANTLTRDHRGAELTCQVSILDLAQDGVGAASIWLVNDGDHDCLVENPLSRSSRGCDFFRLELGHLPEEEEGVTGLGIQYGALAMPRLDNLPSPWDSTHLMVRAGDFLECPLSVPLQPPPSGRNFLRAVYSRYGADDEIGGVPVVRGRAFSEEHEVEMVDGKVRFKGAPAKPSPPASSPSPQPPPSPKPRPAQPNPDLLKTRVDKS